MRDAPPESDGFANIGSPGTRGIYGTDIPDFILDTGICEPLEFRIITRAHVVAYLDELAR